MCLYLGRQRSLVTGRLQDRIPELTRYINLSFCPWTRLLTHNSNVKSINGIHCPWQSTVLCRGRCWLSLTGRETVHTTKCAIFQMLPYWSYTVRALLQLASRHTYYGTPFGSLHVKNYTVALSKLYKKTSKHQPQTMCLQYRVGNKASFVQLQLLG